MACPPEDSGGVGGYYDMLLTLRDAAVAEADPRPARRARPRRPVADPVPSSPRRGRRGSPPSRAMEGLHAAEVAGEAQGEPASAQRVRGDRPASEDRGPALRAVAQSCKLAASPAPTNHAARSAANFSNSSSVRRSTSRRMPSVSAGATPGSAPSRHGRAGPRSRLPLLAHVETQAGLGPDPAEGVAGLVQDLFAMRDEEGLEMT
jgi:hypothetical protein